jgi:hypothetical protein
MHRVPRVTCTQRDSVSLNQNAADVYQHLVSLSSSMHVATQLAQKSAVSLQCGMGTLVQPIPSTVKSSLSTHMLPTSHNAALTVALDTLPPSALVYFEQQRAHIYPWSPAVQQL